MKAIVTMLFLALWLLSNGQDHLWSKRVDKETYTTSRHFDPPINLWFWYGDATGIFLIPTNDKYEEAWKDFLGYYDLYEKKSDFEITVLDMDNGTSETVEAWIWIHPEGYEFMLFDYKGMFVWANKEKIYYIWKLAP